MKKWLVLFVMGLYLFVPFSYVHPGVGWVSIILTLVSGCVNVANAVKIQRDPNNETGISMKAIMLMKLFLFPVYVVLFMVLLMSGILVLTVWWTFLGLFMIPIVIAYSYFVLLTSSALAISRIIILGRRGILSKSKCILHIIMQVFFVADVIDSIIVFAKERKSEG